MGYEARINGRKVQGGGLTSLVAVMAQAFTPRVERTVASVYCDVHQMRPTLMLGTGGRYEINACCEDAKRRAHEALRR